MILWDRHFRLSTLGSILRSLLVLVFLNSSCKNPYGEPNAAHSQFGYKNNVPADFIDDDGSATGFGGGSHVGTTYSNGALSLSTTSNLSELHENWTPKWNDLVAYWKFEEAGWSGTAGEVKDSIGQNHGMRVGDANTTSNAKVGLRAADFDGVDDYVNIDSLIGAGTGLSEGSIAAWVRSSSDSQNDVITISQGATADNLMTFRLGQSTGSLGDESLSFVVVVGGVLELGMYYRHGHTALTDGGWHHVAVSIGGGGNKLYVDGEDVSSKVSFLWGSASSSFFTNLAAADSARIGGLRYNGSEFTSDFNGQIDELAMWRSALSPEDIALIYSRQAAKYAGVMKSRVIDSQSSSTSWKGLKWLAPLPFGKELPHSNESSADYSELVGSTQSVNDDDLMDDILALWHFNEDSLGGAPMGSDFEDVSSNGFHATQSGGVTPGSTGKFFKAAEFDGVDDSLTVNNLPLQGEGTISLWAKDGDLSSHDYLFDSSNGARYLLYQRPASPINYGLYLGSTRIIDPGLSGLIDSTDWTHIVITYDLSHPSKKQIIYKNGVEFDSFNVSFPPRTPSEFYIGRRYSNQYHWTGKLDEFAVWSRSLSSLEVLQLYRRGANRIKMQVRTCSQNDCSDQDSLTARGWKGPGGNEFTFFSELYNNSSVMTSCAIPMNCYPDEFSLDGQVNFFSSDMDFGDFGSNDIDQDSKRYFQYRVILESDDDASACSGTCLPSLQSLEVEAEL